MQTDITDAEVALRAAIAGSLVVERAFGRDARRVPKHGDDFATEVDLRAEEAIREVLREHRPGDGVLGEELEPHDGDGWRTWLVDPLCGTRNFASMTGPFSVNVALREGEDVRVAALAEPLARRVLWTDGADAYERREGRTVHVRPSAASRIVEVNADGAADDIGPRLVSDVRVRSWMSPRVSASTLVLGWVAAGQRAAYVSDGDLRHSVHFAAGIALCRAAGCVIGDLSGGDVHTGDGLLIAADHETWRQLSNHVARHRVPI
ncbi:inositol monophosphatase [Cellulomonas flavigena DSM 20109]|uniref:Inositol monophosphatase n=1 Tax=Cellulomonas flavigena (strain ATCC 482 / DSM 20109 / BCRC 11376 / JCM 18109 / NBRC 3775 / NCIMB 8073 / NRS 134) TaxID=446466 RepID=D5UE38_CELFN|nr:inositol monophosphatase family protein [Cellulomonas flavigena]ADG76514.1 inositol monophosphatase [Cellulomonas flavigena DSM 20109]